MKIAIIGAGPIGLYFAGLCEKNKIDYVVFETTGKPGGQITTLYPQKEIVNIPGIDLIIAKDYVESLLKNVDITKIKYNTKIDELSDLSEFDYIVNATGVGEYLPRKLGLENEENYNVLYNLDDYSFLQNKSVVIFGGGDSALDWAKQLSKISKVALVHRRDEFRGNAATIKDCQLDLYLSAKPYAINDKIITIQSTKPELVDNLTEISYDYILVCFGMAYEKSKLIGDYFIGDCTNEVKTLANGIRQAEDVFKQIGEQNARN